MSALSISEQDIKELALGLLSLNIELYLMPADPQVKIPPAGKMLEQIPMRLAEAADDASGNIRKMGVQTGAAPETRAAFAGTTPEAAPAGSQESDDHFQKLVTGVDATAALKNLAQETGAMAAHVERQQPQPGAPERFAPEAFPGTAAPSAPAPQPAMEVGGVQWETERLLRVAQNAQTVAKLTEEGVAQEHPAEALLLGRKILEVGDQKPIIKTVIGMDGDVYTLVDPRFQHAGLEQLLKLHMSGVSASIQYWGALAGVLSDFLTSIVRVLFRRG